MTFLSRYKLIVVLLVALALRVGAMVVLAPTFDFTLPGNSIHGSEAYDTYAQNLLATGVYGMEPGVADAKIPHSSAMLSRQSTAFSDVTTGRSRS